MGTEKKLLEELKSRRASSFTALREATDLANGTLQHHINSSPEIERRKGAVLHSKSCENCPLKESCGEKCVICLLENERRRRILELKLEGMSNVDIAEELDIHRSTVTFHLSRLPELSGDFCESVHEFL